MAKKILSLILVSVLLCGVLAGCSGEPPDESNTQGLDTNDAVSTEATDSLGQRDYGGKKFTILSRKDTDYEFVGELSGELVEQNVYARNDAVASRFNAKIDVLTEDGGWNDRDWFSTHIQILIMSGNADRVNLVSTHQGYINTMILEGYAMNLRKLPNLDLTAKWWEPHYYEQASIDGKTYFAVGDINLTLYEQLEVVYFNKKLASQHDIEDLYATALEGKWTYEKLYDIAKEFGGSKIQDQELYAIAMNCHSSRALVPAWNISYTVRNATTGRDELFLAGNTKLLDGYSRFYKLMTDTVAHNPYTSTAEMDSQAPLFDNDKALFWFQTLSATDRLKQLDMQSEYGILPFPLWDESQYESVGYLSTAADNRNGVFVLSNLAESEYDFTGMITEALCMYSRDTVVEAYYETNLKYRTDMDPRVVDVLDIVRRGATFSFAQTWSFSLDHVYAYYSNAWTDRQIELSYHVAQKEASQKILLDKIYEKCATLDN